MGGEQKLNLGIRDVFSHPHPRVRKLTKNTFSSFGYACLGGELPT